MTIIKAHCARCRIPKAEKICQNPESGRAPDFSFGAANGPMVVSPRQDGPARWRGTGSNTPVRRPIFKSAAAFFRMLAPKVVRG